MGAIRILARGGAVPPQVAVPVAAVLDDGHAELRAWVAATLAHPATPGLSLC